MRFLRIFVVFAFALALVSTATPAQAADKPIIGYFGIGYSMTTGTTADYLESGWNLSGGVVWHPNPAKPWGVRFDLGWNDFDATNELVSLGQNQNSRIDDGRGSMWSGTADAVFDFGGDRVRGYAGVGLGVYRRYVELTQTALYSGYWCDPWWGVCYPGVTTGDVITDSDSLTKIGYNAALGVVFPLQSGGELYLEARYHYMTSEKGTEYIPIVFGWRF